jgi:hypothetical protein
VLLLQQLQQQPLRRVLLRELLLLLLLGSGRNSLHTHTGRNLLGVQKEGMFSVGSASDKPSQQLDAQRYLTSITAVLMV